MSCEGGACEFKPKKTKVKSEEKLPLPNETTEWTVYGAEWCSYCQNAKSLLESKHVQMNYVDVDKYGGSDSVKNEMSKLTRNQHTIPLIFNKTNFIGGFSDLNIFLKQKNIGGYGSLKSADVETQNVVDKVKEEFESRTAKCYDRFELVNYRTQVVAGVNYLLNVKLSDHEHAHLKVYRNLENEHKLMDYNYPKKDTDSLNNF